MNKAFLWERLKNIIESCKTHPQLDVCRNMIELAYYELMGGRVRKIVDAFNMDSSYYNDLYNKITNKRKMIEDIELLERMNAKTENKEDS